MKDCTHEEAGGYLAGFLDADGSIHGNSRKWGHILPAVCFVNTNLAVLKKISSWFKSNPVFQRAPNEFSNIPTRQTVYQISLYGERARDCLRTMLPFLQIKKIQAELALMAHNNRASRGHRQERGAKMLREWCVGTISNLNKRTAVLVSEHDKNDIHEYGC